MNKTSAKLAIARNIRFFRIENRFSCRELAGGDIPKKDGDVA
nr:MAG TPA: hypothetical protein [Caudoviricetes sp.]